MEYNNFKKQQERLTGYEEQEILIDMLSSSIGRVVGTEEGALKIYVKQSLNDALVKRKAAFKDIKYTTQDEKTRFVNDLVINTIKRAKLVADADKIVPECNRAYDEWKQKYSPGEI
jgi:hypothetical protein